MPQVFRPYAKLWLAPLAKLILSGDVGGLGLNYFVVDLLVTMLSWVPAKLEVCSLFFVFFLRLFASLYRILTWLDV